jgi:flagellar basal-body rod protein FlgB
MMFIERLMNQGNAPLLEQMVKFSQARHRLLAENIVNISTPRYRQKDLSLERFQHLLRERVAQRNGAPVGSVRFDDLSVETEYPRRNILFHDQNNRSVEQLMSDQAQNALMHNLMTELLRKQFESVQNALKERVT